jgi:predicted RNA binding protein YcfA (HicA-like mRNA interferase family)
MPKILPVSGHEIIRALQRLGFRVASQRGSHVKLKRGSKICIVPTHKEVKKGTLAGILRQAGVSAEELLAALSQ